MRKFEEVHIMILLTILAVIALLVGAIAFVLIALGGTTFIVIFGDLIVCVALIIFIMRKLIKRHRR